MTPERFQQLRNLFDAALDRDPAERTPFLDAACRGDLELRQEAARLLTAHETSTHRVEEAISLETGVIRTDPKAREGSFAGPYEILRELGHGGMGTVYLARRADQTFQKLVAVKILRADIASGEFIRRFQREREILAALDHPNVTRLLDAGTTEDRLPYFVMEYVEGESLLEYCDRHQLSIAERLGLFRQLCDAVVYAHQSGVVHRDLKPGNILIADGHVKVLDFGIARMVRGENADDTLTAGSLMLMTPQYASPEQVRGNPATPQSDVYSLGVILYELLTGHSPYHLHDRIYHEIVRVICEVPPERPSAIVTTPLEVESSTPERRVTVAPETGGRLRKASVAEWQGQLRGDLDAVVMKALSKQPVDRYHSAEQLRADVNRRLEGEPVWAREMSWAQRSVIAISHYRGAVTSGIAIAAAVLSGAVKLHVAALYYALGAGLIFLVWYLLTNRELQRKMADSFLTSPLCIGALTALAFLPMMPFFRRGPVLYLVRDVWGVLLLIVVVWYCLAWFVRKRWTGSLVTRLSGTNPLWVVFLIAHLGQLIEDLPKLVHGETSWTIFVGDHATSLALVGAMYLSGRKEIRQAGILRGGQLIRWGSIRSWAWLPRRAPSSNHPGFVTLKLDLYHPMPLFARVRLIIIASEKEKVEAILERQLGKWPAW